MLPTTLEQSYDLLSAPEQQVFCCLAVFAGSSELEAAEAVCAAGAIVADGVLDLLARLVSRSLVLVVDRAATARYRLLEPVR
ncbi:MAG: hypothetical protein JO023_05915 [Chloroflexi bacterium]|nr:hypothetical protein [Chloroflexota bacterium]